MRFSILVVTLMMAQTALAGPDPGALEGEQLRRRRPAAPVQQEQAPPPPAAAQEAPPPPDDGYDDGQEEPPPAQTQIIENNNVVVQNQEFHEGVEGEFYTPGYGGLPQNWSQRDCQTVYEGRDQFTGAPLVNIIATDGLGRGAYRTLPAPMPIGPGRINLILAFNGLIRNGVCPGPLLPQPVIQQQWGYQQAPVFVPYQGVRRAPVQFVNPQYNYNRGVYRPVPVYGRPPNGGPFAAPPMRQFARPPGR